MKKVTAFAIFWQFFHLSSCSLAYLKYANMKAINWGQPLAGHRLNATPIATSKVSNRIKCMAECGKTQGCVAINLGPNQVGEHECEFLSNTRYGFSFVNITAEAGWTYTGPKVWNTCRQSPVRTGDLDRPQIHSNRCILTKWEFRLISEQLRLSNRIRRGLVWWVCVY